MRLPRTSNETRLHAFQKWVASGGAGLQLECAIRMKKSKELREEDCGHYLDWSSILGKFQNNVLGATAFIQRRRSEAKGTCLFARFRSTRNEKSCLCMCMTMQRLRRTKMDLNDPTVEKFLWFDDSSFKAISTTVATRQHWLLRLLAWLLWMTRKSC